MGKAAYKAHVKMWIYPGDAAWHFVTIPEELSAQVKAKHGMHARGFGSLPVRVTIGKTTWKTSVFPDRKSGTYLLPIKAAVRAKEQVQEGDMVSLAFTMEV